MLESIQKLINVGSGLQYAYATSNRFHKVAVILKLKSILDQSLFAHYVVVKPVIKNYIHFATKTYSIKIYSNVS